MHISGNGENTNTADSGHRRQDRNADDRYSENVIVLPEREVLTVIRTNRLFEYSVFVRSVGE